MKLVFSALTGLLMVACAPESAEMYDYSDEALSEKSKDDNNGKGRRLVEGTWLTTIDDTSVSTCGILGDFISGTEFELVWTGGRTFEQGDSDSAFECEMGNQQTFECDEYAFDAPISADSALGFSSFPTGEIVPREQFMTQYVTTVTCDGLDCEGFGAAIGASFPCELVIETTNDLVEAG